MDIGLPRCSGLEATHRIKAEMPCTKILRLTMSSGSRDLFAALQSGADGYLLKNLEPYQLFDMLDGLRREEAPLSGALAATTLQQFANPPGAPRPSDADDQFTPGEIEVLEQLVSGASDKEIAGTLCITEHTVKLHLRNILKLHARNRVQAAVFAVHQRLVDVAPQAAWWTDWRRPLAHPARSGRQTDRQTYSSGRASLPSTPKRAIAR
jgi:DNA-binding NarL/FixJ family response regulator